MRKKTQIEKVDARLMHGVDYDGQNPTGMLLQEKYDGIRLWWTGRNFYTRDGNQVRVPIQWAMSLPLQHQLDCELIPAPGMHRNACISNGAITYGCTLIVFDLIGHDEIMYQERLHLLREIIGTVQNIVVPGAVYCEGVRHVNRALDAIKRAGGEGIMLKARNLPYKPGRTTGILKVKRPVTMTQVRFRAQMQGVA